MDVEAPPAHVANTITLANGVELKIGSGEGARGGVVRGALPKGTVRKWVAGAGVCVWGVGGGVWEGERGHGQGMNVCLGFWRCPFATAP